MFLCFLYDFSYLIVSFDEILNYEVQENGKIVARGSFNTDIKSKFHISKKNKDIERLQLIIKLKRYDVPEIIYELINNKGKSILTNAYYNQHKKLIDNLQKIFALFDRIKKYIKKQ